ncbi:MAG: uroporphyrinogen decarboxylase family protein [Armatimonadota bacterium]
MNPSYQRVMAACAFRPPDRIPRYDKFWAYPEDWQRRFGPADELTDVWILPPNETPFPSRARRLREEGDEVYSVDAWGRTLRGRKEAYFTETLTVPIPEGTDPDDVEFESPAADQRYLLGCADAETAERELARLKARYCLFVKTGGPYLRTTFVRGEAEYLQDIAGDPEYARALADKMAAHLAAVGVEALRRWGLQDTGVWIYDDMAYNDAPMFSPAAFEQVFLPGYRHMVNAYKAAGARYVFLHSDGNIRPILDMLVDAGIEGLNPLERRAGMDPVRLREQYPCLVLTGGMCNSDTLINGPIDKIQAEARELIDLGRNGGVIIGTHSISPEVPIDHFAAYDETCRAYGIFADEVIQ